KDLAKDEFITQKIKYPTPMELTEFKTNDEGFLVLPENLVVGEYELHEVKAPEGYVLDGKPLPFYVAEHHKKEDYVVVEFGNVPQLGNATIFKTGDTVT